MEPFASELIELDDTLEVVEAYFLYAFRRPWADGSTAVLLTPLERLERLTVRLPARLAARS